MLVVSDQVYSIKVRRVRREAYRASKKYNSELEFEALSPSALKNVTHYQTLLGKFSTIDPDLAAEGIIKIVVEEKMHKLS